MSEGLYAKIISWDWKEAVIAYNSAMPGVVELHVSWNGGVRYMESLEADGLGRITIDDLMPDTTYSIELTQASGRRKLEFKTLPAPEGPELARLALVADPHLSTHPENRKGRCMVESAMILTDVVNQCNSLSPDLVVVPGDITNKGSVDEFKLAGKLLTLLDAPILAVPGNHDLPNPAAEALWTEYFGAKSGVRRVGDFTIVGLNTANARLSASDASLLEDELKRPGKLIIASHYQLFHNPRVYRGNGAKTIVNSLEYTELLNSLSERDDVIIYAGHQNVPSRFQAGDAMQLNLPQPTQYPCGFILTQAFANGLYHSFIPISSEIIRQWSRCAGNAAAGFHNESQWESEYRSVATDMNFIHEFTPQLEIVR